VPRLGDHGREDERQEWDVDHRLAGFQDQQRACQQQCREQRADPQRVELGAKPEREPADGTEREPRQRQHHLDPGLPQRRQPGGDEDRERMRGRGALGVERRQRAVDQLVAPHERPGRVIAERAAAVDQPRGDRRRHDRGRGASHGRQRTTNRALSERISAVTRVVRRSRIARRVRAGSRTASVAWAPGRTRAVSDPRPRIRSRTTHRRGAAAGQ
jgi:hypothetical protein